MELMHFFGLLACLGYRGRCYIQRKITLFQYFSLLGTIIFLVSLFLKIHPKRKVLYHSMASTSKICGFTIIGKQREVPLKEIKTDVSINGFIANVESKLEYFNKETTPVETEFVFPLDSKTAVYKFEAEINGRHIVAECQGKSQAYETYQDAKDSGHSAMLLSEEEKAGDVFSLRLGNLDANSKAVLTLAYVVELDVEVHGVLRFTLPIVLCPRYTSVFESVGDVDGDQDQPIEETQKDAQRPFLDSPDVSTQYGSGKFKMSFSATVSGGYKINKITSRHDDISVSLEGNETDAKVSLKESFKHDRDLSFDIHYEDFDKPEIVLEKGTSKKGDFMSSDVLMLNFLPRWQTDTTEMKCEFVFVIDRSGSMGGHRIEKAKEALLLLLKSLPMDCFFNVISFGSDFSSLFKTSQQYSKKTLDEALSLQKTMDADLGGTEILKPLQSIYRSKPKKDYRRQIFLLTDGSVSDTQSVINLMKDNASTSRVFTFGIGDGCSTELIRKAASVSQGMSTFVKDTDRLQTKVLSVLKKSTMNAVTDLAVKFDLPSNVQHTMLPTELPCLFKGDKLLLYTVLNGDTKVQHNSSLTLSAVFGDQKIKHTVSFDLNNVAVSNVSAPLHRLAAKAQLERMEEDHDKYSSPDSSMITISKATNTVCCYTAFVGVDKESQVVIKNPSFIIDHDVIDIPRSHFFGLSCQNKSCYSKSVKIVSSYACSLPLERSSLSASPPVHQKMAKKFLGGFSFPSLGSIFSRKKRSSASPAISAMSEPMSAQKNTDLSCDIDNMADECCMDEEKIEGGSGVKDLSCGGTVANSKQDDRMIDLISKQAFEGCWKLDENLASILGKPIKELKDKCPVKDVKIWATVLALAYLQMKYKKRKPEWQMIEEKASLWLSAQDLKGKTEEDLIAEAKCVLS